MPFITSIKSAEIDAYTNELFTNIEVLCIPNDVKIIIKFCGLKSVHKFSKNDFIVNDKIKSTTSDAISHILSKNISLNISELPYKENSEVTVSISFPDNKDSLTVTHAVKVSNNIKFNKGVFSGNQLTGEICLLGWVLGRQEDDIIRIQLDGENRLLDTVFHLRPDVDKLHPWNHDSEAGWKASFHTKQLLLDDVSATAYYMRNNKIIHTIRGKVNINKEGINKPTLYKIKWSRFKQQLPDLIASALRGKGRLWALKSKGFWYLWRNDISISRMIRRSIVQKMLRQNELDKNVIIRLRSGHIINANQTSDYVIARKFIFEGGYETGFEDWLCNFLKEGDIFIDAGACYGHLSLSASAVVKKAGHVYSIEANPTTQKFFRSNMLMNKVKNVTLINKAIADSDNKATFLALDQGSTGGSRLADSMNINTKEDLEDLMSSLKVVSKNPHHLGLNKYSNNDEIFEAKEVAVDVTTLDRICEQVNSPINLIKMDLEGGEWLAIKGAERLINGKFGPPPVVVLEYSNLFPTAGGKRSNILDYFLEKKWRVFKFKGGKAEGGSLQEFFTEEEAPNHDNIAFIPPHLNIL